MNGTIDREEIRAFISEQFDVVEEQGGVSIVALMHHAHTGPVELLSLKTGHAKWGNADAMAGLFDAYAARHAKGVVGGGAQQYELTVCRGTDNRPSSVLPFIRVGATSVLGPSGSIATEPPTELGLRQQAQRWGEQITQMTFAGIQGLQHSQQAAIDSRDRRIAEVEKTNSELWIACKQLLLELDKQRHDIRMSELAAARAAEFQRQVMALAPALVNMVAGRDIFPNAIAEKSLLDGLSAGTTPEQMRTFATVVATQVQNGDKLSAVLMDHYNKYHEKMGRVAAEEKRLLQSVPGGYDAGERDAAGDAIKVLRGQSLEEGEKQLPASGVVVMKALNGAIERAKADEPSVEQNGAPAATEKLAAFTKEEGDALLDVMLEGASAAEIDMLSGILAAKRPDVPDLADRIKARFAAITAKREAP